MVPPPGSPPPASAGLRRLARSREPPLDPPVATIWWMFSTSMRWPRSRTLRRTSRDALLELPPESRPGDERAQVQDRDGLAPQRLGHRALLEHERQLLHEGRLPHARLPHHEALRFSLQARISRSWSTAFSRAHQGVAGLQADALGEVGEDVLGGLGLLHLRGGAWPRAGPGPTASAPRPPGGAGSGGGPSRRRAGRVRNRPWRCRRRPGQRSPRRSGEALEQAVEDARRPGSAGSGPGSPATASW